MKKALFLTAMVIGLFLVGCDEECVHPNDDRCISRWIKEGAFPYLTCEEVDENLLSGQVFATTKEVNIHNFDGRDTIAMGWASNGRIVFLSTQLPDDKEFGVLVEPFILPELLKLDIYRDAFTYECDMETDVTSDELESMWENPGSPTVFICSASGQPNEVPGFYRMVYVWPPSTAFYLGDLGFIEVRDSNKNLGDGKYAISTCQ